MRPHASRAALLAALERLDDRTDQSDQYQNSVIGSAAIGFAAKGEVLGETSLDPVVDQVPSDELKAQVALVRAAKDEIRGPTPATFASLQAAQSGARGHEGPGHLADFRSRPGAAAGRPGGRAAAADGGTI